VVLKKTGVSTVVFRITKSVDISFAHHIRGHGGNCINLHGHTWKFELIIESDELTPEGFVIDFSDLKSRILQPCHALLDHALAVGESTYAETKFELEKMGESLLASRLEYHDRVDTLPNEKINLNGAQNEYPGGLKIAVFPFNPTSERFAEWLYHLAETELSDGRVRVHLARVYETLHPVESVAEFSLS
jgi:6-pyruvoyl tetrahydropterin synthase/QueD family protein